MPRFSRQRLAEDAALREATLLARVAAIGEELKSCHSESMVRDGHLRFAMQQMETLKERLQQGRQRLETLENRRRQWEAHELALESLEQLFRSPQDGCSAAAAPRTLAQNVRARHEEYEAMRTELDTCREESRQRADGLQTATAELERLSGGVSSGLPPA